MLRPVIEILWAWNMMSVADVAKGSELRTLYFLKALATGM